MKSLRRLIPTARIADAFISIAVGVLFLGAGCSSPSRSHYDRNLFNTGLTVSGTQPYPKYDPALLERLLGLPHNDEVSLKMFDLINEAALLRDKTIKPQLDRYRDSLGYIPSLALRHYHYALGDTSQLDWLLAEDKKSGIGRDSLILTVFGYMDEWDRTVKWFKENSDFNDRHEGGGAAGEVLARAIQIRKQIYGADRFEAAWKRIQ